MYEVGSTWRRWDLHIHSPQSHPASYGGSDDAWDRFLADLAAPPAFGVIGINDYMWVDGYEPAVVEAVRRMGAEARTQTNSSIVRYGNGYRNSGMCDA